MPNLFGSNWKKDELRQYVGHMDQVAGIQAVEATDGLARGNRIFHVWTGSGLTFDVVPERALDITACRYKGMSLAWMSSVGGTHPAFYESEGLGWLRSFGGGLLTTCGLDQFGPPNEDDGESLGLHGRISNLPAQAVGYSTAWRGDDYVLEITGEVRQTRVFGENLVLRRCISTALGSNKLRIEDTIANEGFEPYPHMLLYHINLGFPLVGPNTRLSVEGSGVMPRDAEAEVGLGQWSEFQVPTAGYREQVFRHQPQAAENGVAQANIENPDLGLALQLSFDQKTLPYLFQWKMMGQGTYVLGIEPTNCGVLHGRSAAREQGDLPYLQPGEQRQYWLELELKS
jgi:galactose mutarotase-like enzyme